MAARTSSPSWPSPSENMVRSSESSVKRVISSATSSVEPLRASQRATSMSAERIMAVAKPITVLREKVGASVRRCIRHCSPSTVSRPCLRPTESTRSCNASLR
jgi:hypothetical protein